MKIILVDNFNREGPGHNDTLIAEKVNKHFIKKICEFLNLRFGGINSPNYFRPVENDYKPHKFKP